MVGEPMERSTSWRLVEEIFTEAMVLPTSQQSAFVEVRCGQDTAVRDQVLNLLGAHREMGGFLQSSVFDLRGQEFGPYRAVEEAGRGGMSVVYKGERIDGSFDNPVAIKVVFADAALLPETKILASLEHANVARLLDAGVTAVGLRYLVMEFVAGTPCSAWAPGHTEPEKLRVFLQICSGVQAAHRSLIVHRGLKPDNVLVNAEGIVKLLDFGIAKQLSPAGTQTALLRAYTPDYASPEQILGRPASTSNDIYSLGVILCEMLTGSMPRPSARVPLDEWLRSIERGEMAVSIEGDLGHIVRKAIHADPSQRYQSAADLACDIEAYLDRRPISARPDSRSYRTRRFVVRNRWPVAGAAVAAVAIGAAAATALWQARLAQQRFELVRKLSNSVLFEINDAVEKLPGSLPARELLVRHGVEYLDSLSKTAGANTGLQTEIARAYLRLSMITGNGALDLGRGQDALGFSRRAEAIMRQVVSRQPGDAEAGHWFLTSLDTVRSYLERNGKLDGAPPLLAEMGAVAEERLRRSPGEFLALMDAVRVHAVTAEHYALQPNGRGPVDVVLRAAVDGYRRAVAAKPQDQEAQLELSRSLFGLAQWHDDRYELKPAREYLTESLRLATKLAADGELLAPQAVMAISNQLANVAKQEGNFEESMRLFEQQRPFARTVAEANPVAASPKKDLGALF
ncbi:MAG: hypothetical protein FJW31_21625 [Acidobacteria bacterium]|nr:hypothetical protein [Acidobacteriota bacterium]